jgi:hypothetical protein
MTYSQRLRDPRWQKKRLEIFERDDWACKFCGTKEKNLQVHHVVYGKLDPWDYPNYLYQTLCEDCHSVRQELTNKIVDAVRIAIKETPTERLTRVAQHLCNAAMLEIEPDFGFPCTPSVQKQYQTQTQGDNGV